MSLEVLVPVAIVALLAGLYIFAKDTAVVAGKVFDGKKEPAAGTQVRIGRAVTYTDASGRFQFTDIPFGMHVISIRHGEVVKERPIRIKTQSMVLYETLA